MPYSTEAPARTNPGDSGGPQGWICRYAWGDDYHAVLGEELRELLAAMREKIAQPFDAGAYVDTAPW